MARYRHRLPISVSLLISLCSLWAYGQPAPPRERLVQYRVVSPKFNGGQGAPATRLVFTSTIKVAGAAYLRAYFANVSLGEGSYITVSSVKDGKAQRLTADQCRQWRNTTAYFNGDAISLALYLTKGDTGVGIDVDRIVVGAPEEGPTEALD